MAFVWLLFCFTLGLRAQGELHYTPHPDDTYPTFSLTLRAKAPEFRIGSRMRITVTQTNLTKHDIECQVINSGIDTMFGYEATDEDGKPAEKLAIGTGAMNVYPSFLSPGEGVDRSILIDRIFKFDRPGKYVIRVSRREPDVKDEKGEPIIIWSNPITITITW